MGDKPFHYLKLFGIIERMYVSPCTWEFTIQSFSVKFIIVSFTPSLLFVSKRWHFLKTKICHDQTFSTDCASYCHRPTTPGASSESGLIVLVLWSNLDWTVVGTALLCLESTGIYHTTQLEEAILRRIALLNWRTLSEKNNLYGKNHNVIMCYIYGTTTWGINNH